MNLFELLFYSGYKSMLVNMLTLYRILISPALLVMLFNDHPAFKWALLSAFITDALDGFMARKFKVTSKLGAKLDSLADDILFIVAIASVMYLHHEIFIEDIIAISIIVALFISKMIILIFKHKKIISGLHTYASKTAAFFQAIFFLQAIFFDPSHSLFILTLIITTLAICEEIMIVCAFKDLPQNVKGILFGTYNNSNHQ